MQTANGNSRVTSQATKVTLVLHIFKLVLYFNSTIISNQIKYYLVINIGNFLQIQYGFYMHALQIHYELWWLVIGRACIKKNSKKLMSVTWLFGASWWKLIKALSLYEIVHVIGQWVGLVLGELYSTLTQIHITFNH